MGQTTMAVKTVRLRPALGCVLNSDQQGLLGNPPNGQGYGRKPGCSTLMLNRACKMLRQTDASRPHAQAIRMMKYFLAIGAIFLTVTRIALPAVSTLTPEQTPHRRLPEMVQIKQALAELTCKLVKTQKTITRNRKSIDTA